MELNIGDKVKFHRIWHKSCRGTIIPVLYEDQKGKEYQLMQYRGYDCLLEIKTEFGSIERAFMFDQIKHLNLFDKICDFFT